MNIENDCLQTSNSNKTELTLNDDLINLIKSISFDNNKNYIIKDILTREYIYNYIYGNIDRANYSKFIFDYFDISIKPNIVLTIIYDDFWIICEKDNNTYRYKMKRKLLECTNIITENIKCVSTTLIGTDKVVLLLDCDNRNKFDSENYAIKIAQYLCDKLKKMTGYSISIGLSNYKYNINEINIAYEESFRALENIFRKGKGKVIKFSDKEDEIDDPIYNIENVIHNLVIELGRNNINNVQYILQNFYNIIIKSKSADYSLKSVIIIFISEITNYFTFKNNKDIMSKNQIDSINSILRSNTIDDIFEIITDFSINLSTYLKNDNSLENGIYIAKSYLDKYYMLEITLEKISYIAGYSTSYFSRSFKKIIGQSYIEYLFNRRIKEAKRLLTETNKSILEISIDTGFENFSYFSSSFKTNTGLSPTEYRNIKPRHN